MSDNLDKLKVIETKLIDPELTPKLLDGVPDALVVINESGLIVMVNGATELMFGHPRSALYEKPLDIILPERFRDKHREHISRYMANPSVRPMGRGLLLLGMHKSGREFSIEINLAPVVSASGTFAIAAVRRVEATHGGTA